MNKKITDKYYLPRDVSWMYFNHRILQEAMKEDVPLLERLSFLGIYSNNLDEFFRVCVATLSRVAECEDKAAKKERESATHVLKQIGKLNSLYAREYEATVRNVVAELRKENIFLIDDTGLDEEQQTFVTSYYRERLNGKKVTVVIELLARFDEASNIGWSKKMQDAGVHVIFGVEGLKVHSKITHIEMRTGADIACISTGNFHEGNARAYTDCLLMRASKNITHDVLSVFGFIERPYSPVKFKELLVSPNEMKQKFIRLINEEIRNKETGKPAYIRAKLNHITDTAMVKKLYEASGHGVRVDLVVRGCCSLMTGVAGVSDTIRINGIIDRYLEHSRIFIFAAGGEEKVFMGSADWMPHNLDNRMEVVTPVYDPEIKSELKRIVDYALRDTSKGRTADGNRSFKKIFMQRVPLRLGFDVFSEGKISKRKAEKLNLLMRSFRLLMDIYDVNLYRACATSAMRDASNGGRIIRRIAGTSGIDIEIISGKEEARVIYSNHIECMEDRSGNYMYVDVGGGSTEINLLTDGTLRSSVSYDLGTVRMLNNAVHEGTPERMAEELGRMTGGLGEVNIIGTGGNINKLFKLADDKDKERKLLPVDELSRLYDNLAGMSVEQRAEAYELKEDRADVIVPAAEIFLRIAGIVHARYIHVPVISLADGIIDGLFTK